MILIYFTSSRSDIPRTSCFLHTIQPRYWPLFVFCLYSYLSNCSIVLASNCRLSPSLVHVILQKRAVRTTWRLLDGCQAGLLRLRHCITILKLPSLYSFKVHSEAGKALGIVNRLGLVNIHRQSQYTGELRTRGDGVQDGGTSSCESMPTKHKTCTKIKILSNICWSKRESAFNRTMGWTTEVGLCIILEISLFMCHCKNNLLPSTFLRYLIKLHKCTTIVTEPGSIVVKNLLIQIY